MAIPANTVENCSIEATGQSQIAKSQRQGTNGEHSPDPQAPTSVVNLLKDDGPTPWKAQRPPETEKTERDEQTQRERENALEPPPKGEAQLGSSVILHNSIA